MKKYIWILTFLAISGFLGAAHAIPVGTFGDVDVWADDAARVSGTGGDFAGVDAVQALIGDDLTDGAINLDTDDKFRVSFSGGITNGVGADFVVFDGRFSADGVYLTVDAGGTELYISSGSFVDSGLDFILKNSSYRFDLYGVALDLSDWGYGIGDTVYDLVLGGDGESDIMGVGILGSSSNAVPEPATLLLFGFGLLGLAKTGRKN